MVNGLIRLARQCRRIAKDNQAATAGEFVIVAPIIIAIILATLQIGVLFAAKAYIETGAEEAARTVLTNKAVVSANGATVPMTQAQFQAAVCAELPALFNCSNLIVILEPLPSGTTNLSTLLPTFDSSGALKTTLPFSTGSSGQLMFLLVAYQWPVYGGVLGLNFNTMGNGTTLLTSTQIFKTEI
jgi:Flp pilus assembly protein TadG